MSQFFKLNFFTEEEFWDQPYKKEDSFFVLLVGISKSLQIESFLKKDLLITAYLKASGACVIEWGSSDASSALFGSQRRAESEWISSVQLQQMFILGGEFLHPRYSRSTLQPAILRLSALIMGGIPQMLCMISNPLFPLS